MVGWRGKYGSAGRMELTQPLEMQEQPCGAMVGEGK